MEPLSQFISVASKVIGSSEELKKFVSQFSTATIDWIKPIFLIEDEETEVGQQVIQKEVSTSEATEMIKQEKSKELPAAVRDEIANWIKQNGTSDATDNTTINTQINDSEKFINAPGGTFNNDITFS